MKQHTKRSLAVFLTVLLAVVLFAVGSFTVLASYCAHQSVDASGLCTSCGTQMVASVKFNETTTYYTDLINAFTYANGKKATIDMLADYSVPENKTGSPVEYMVSLSISDLTWNLNGFDIVTPESYQYDTYTYQSFIDLNGTSLTINAENNVLGENIHNDVFVQLFRVGGNYINSRLIINGGSFRYADRLTRLAYLQAYGEMYINGSEIDTKTPLYLENGTMVLDGGTIECGIWIENSAELFIINGDVSDITISNYTLEQSYYGGDPMSMFQKGSNVAKLDGTPVSAESFLDSGDGYRYIGDIVVTGCPHLDVSGVLSAGNSTHITKCNTCEKTLTTESCTGGNATCTNAAICEVCRGAYGNVDSKNHTSDAFVYIPYRIGSHSKCYACCKLSVGVEACTYSEVNDSCITCGGSGALIEEYTAAEKQLRDAVEEKIAATNARTDVTDEYKAYLINQYNSWLVSTLDRLLSATTSEELLNLKKQYLCCVDLMESYNDFMFAVEVHYTVLTNADMLWLQYAGFMIDQYEDMIFETTDQELLDSLKLFIGELTDYAEACVDLFVYINTLPNISHPTVKKDLIKQELFGGEFYPDLFDAIEALEVGVSAGEPDFGKAMVYGFIEIYKKAADKLDANLDDQERCQLILSVCDSIIVDISHLNFETHTVEDIEQLVENGMVQLDHTFIQMQYFNISLGEDISVNYYVTIQDDVVPKIRFTLGSYTKTVSPTEVDGMHKFVFDGVSPQWMNDTITAELIVDGTVTVTRGDNVYDYLLSLENYAPGELGMSEEKYNAMLVLIDDLLVYGGAAQRYTGHRTDALVDDGITGSTFTPIETTDLALENNGSYVTFKSATVFFNSINTLRFKLAAEDMTNVVLKCAVNGGAEIELAYKDNGDGTYTVETEGIYAVGFDDVYTITAYKDGTAGASIDYSVKSYVYSKQNGSGAMAELAKATYNYGLAAVAFRNAQ